MARSLAATRMPRRRKRMAVSVEQSPRVDSGTRSEAGLVLRAEGVRKVYRSGADEVEALRGVDLDVNAGEFVAIMGPSGSGMTTLLNCFSGLDSIDGGRVLIEGR